MKMKKQIPRNDETRMCGVPILQIFDTFQPDRIKIYSPLWAGARKSIILNSIDFNCQLFFMYFITLIFDL